MAGCLQIAWLKVFSGSIGAIEVPLVSWLVRNYESVNTFAGAAAALLAAIIAVAIVTAVVRLYRCLKLLEES